MNNFPWDDELPNHYGEQSSGNESDSSGFSLSSSGKSNQDDSDREHPGSSGSKSHIVSVSNLNRFAKKIDKAASLDDQAADLTTKIMHAFVKDVASRMVKLAKYRDKNETDLSDLTFVLKREYNIEFSQPKEKNKKRK